MYTDTAGTLAAATLPLLMLLIIADIAAADATRAAIRRQRCRHALFFASADAASRFDAATRHYLPARLLLLICYQRLRSVVTNRAQCYMSADADIEDTPVLRVFFLCSPLPPAFMRAMPSQCRYAYAPAVCLCHISSMFIVRAYLRRHALFRPLCQPQRLSR